MSEFGLTVNRTRKDGTRYKKTYKPVRAPLVTKGKLTVGALGVAALLAATGNVGNLPIVGEGIEGAAKKISGNVNVPAVSIPRGNDNPPERKPISGTIVQSSPQTNEVKKVEPSPNAKPSEQASAPQRADQITKRPNIQIVVTNPDDVKKIVSTLQTAQNVTVKPPDAAKAPAPSVAAKPAGK